MLDRAAQILRECEQQLRNLIVEASTTGDYDAVDLLTGWARGIASFVASASPASISNESAKPYVVPSGARRSEHIGARPSTTAAPTTEHRPQRRTAKAASLYPKFSRQRSELIKTGWSKKEKREYQHRAPWSVAETLVRRLSGYGGRRFTSEEIFPLTSQEGAEIPSYQAYLCLAWLKAGGLITQDGRQGYYVSAVGDFFSEVQSRWEKMM